MPSNVRRYLWLIQALSSGQHLTFEELATKWKYSAYNDDGRELLLRTFHNHKSAIEMDFGICIACDRADGNRYYISNPEVLKSDLSLMHLLNYTEQDIFLMAGRELKGRIMLEPISRGTEWLMLISRAMMDGRCLRMSYRSFYKDNSCTQYDCVKPYGLRLFNQRWYMIAEVGREYPYIYALDRIEALSLSTETFVMPADFSMEEYFRYAYGIVHAGDAMPEHLRIKVDSIQVPYLRTLPLHASQREIEATDEYAVFEYELAGTYDLISVILSMGDTVEVISEGKVRDYMKDITQSLRDKYLVSSVSECSPKSCMRELF